MFLFLFIYLLPLWTLSFADTKYAREIIQYILNQMSAQCCKILQSARLPLQLLAVAPRLRLPLQPPPSHSTQTHTSWNTTRICCCCFCCCCWPSGEICHFLHNKIYLSSSCPLPFGGVAAVAATSAAAAATVDVVGSRIASIVAALKTLTAHLLVVRTWLRSSFFPLQLLFPLPPPPGGRGQCAKPLCLGLKSITAVVVVAVAVVITPKDFPRFAGPSFKLLSAYSLVSAEIMKSPCIIRHISCHRYNRSILLSAYSSPLSFCLWQYSFHPYCCCRCGLLAALLLPLQLQLHFAVCLLSVTVFVAVAVSVSFWCLFVCCCCAAKSILLHISLGDKSQTWQMMLPLICARNARTGHSAVRYN